MYNKLNDHFRFVLDPMPQRMERARSQSQPIAAQSDIGHLRELATLKNRLSMFFDRIGKISPVLWQDAGNIVQLPQRVRQAQDINQINHALEGLLLDIADQDEASHMVQTLNAAEEALNEANSRIQRLEQELEQLHEQARIDHLTGALNRQGLEDAFRREVARARRGNSPLSMALLDIDNFKRLNDTYGHMVGDAALIHLVMVLLATLRPTDIVARYGGEEFIVVMPDTIPLDAVAAMQRVQVELTHTLMYRGGKSLLLTFSAGVAQLQADDTLHSLIERADLAMYRAKEAGKQRVELCSRLHKMALEPVCLG